MGFYEMSGGADFVPETRPAAVAVATTKIAPAKPQAVAQVTRALAPALITVTPPAEVVSPTPNTGDIVAAVVAPAETVAAPTDVEAAIVSVSAPVDDQPITPETAPLDLRVVAGRRVNMRAGPGTNFGVLDTLPGGTDAEVIEINADGWAKIRILDTGQIGWMAERLLTAS